MENLLSDSLARSPYAIAQWASCEAWLAQSPFLLNQAQFWIEHTPFADWLIGAQRPNVLVELGTHTGVSYLGFCEAIERHNAPTRAYAVDTWRGDKHVGHYGDEVFLQLSDYHKPRYAHFSRLVRSTFDDALRHFDDGGIDLLHIDGEHEYQDVKHDFESWRPKLSDRAIVLFHDTNVRENNFGVFKLWAELAPHFPHFEFAHCNGLGVLGVGKALPGPVNALFSLSANLDAANELRSHFAQLGGSLADRVQLAQAKLDSRQQKAEIADRQAFESQINVFQAEIDALKIEIDSRKAETDAQKTETAALRAEISALRTEVIDRQTFEAQINVFQAEIDALKTEVDSQKAEQALRKRIIDDLEAKSREPGQAARLLGYLRLPAARFFR